MAGFTFAATVNSVTSNIIGATTMAQLKSNIESTQVKLFPELLQELEAIQKEFSNPCP